MIRRMIAISVLFISGHSALYAGDHQLHEISSINPNEIVLSTTSIPSRGSVKVVCKISNAYKSTKHIYVAPLKGDVEIWRYHYGGRNVGGYYMPLGSAIDVTGDSYYSEFDIFDLKKSNEALTIDISDARDMAIKCTY